MHGFNNFDYDELFSGSEIIQICFGSNEIIINLFPEDRSITIFDVDNFYLDNPDFLKKINNNSADNSIIGAVISKIEILNNHCAIIHLSNDIKIELRDGSPKFESFLLMSNGKTVVV